MANLFRYLSINIVINKYKQKFTEHFSSRFTPHVDKITANHHKHFEEKVYCWSVVINSSSKLPIILPGVQIFCVSSINHQFILLCWSDAMR